MNRKTFIFLLRMMGEVMINLFLGLLTLLAVGGLIGAMVNIIQLLNE